MSKKQVVKKTNVNQEQNRVMKEAVEAVNEVFVEGANRGTLTVHRDLDFATIKFPITTPDGGVKFMTGDLVVPVKIKDNKIVFDKKKMKQMRQQNSTNNSEITTTEAKVQ